MSEGYRSEALSQSPERGLISAGLDYYKLTMSQFIYEHEPEAEVRFSLINRNPGQRLADHVDPGVLQQRLDDIRTAGWTEPELDYLAGLHLSQGNRVFTDRYLDFLRLHKLPSVEVKLDPETNDLAIDVDGPWAVSSLWETIILGEIDEAYFEGYMRHHGIDPQTVYAEGDRRLDQKIAVLKDNPGIKFADFGTRRHFSLGWQKHAIERVLAECPDNLIGTSNVGLASSLGLKPIGTFAHEMLMVYAALADLRGQNVRSSHNRFLQEWFDFYGPDYSIALTDTFTTDFFFSDFTAEQAEAWRGTRQDSGDPVEYVTKLVQFYASHGVDPRTKTVVFSDGLNIDKMVDLCRRFGNQINIQLPPAVATEVHRRLGPEVALGSVVDGWGTGFTNDLGIPPLNIVIKATSARLPSSHKEAYTVKLSDDVGKHLGPLALVQTYQSSPGYFAPVKRGN